MKTFLIDRGGILLLLLLVGIAIHFFYDLAHPELWSDCQHDPRLYGTLTVVVLPPLLLWWAWEERKLKRLQQRFKSLREANHENSRR